MNELLLRDLIRSGSAFALLAVHALVLLYGKAGGRRGLRTAAAYLVAFDWALILGVTAGRSVADGSTLFWSWHTVRWGLLGVLLLFMPAWLLLQLGLRFSGTLLLPAMPTDREQREQAGRTLRAYAWGVNRPFYREEDGELRKVAEGSLMRDARHPGRWRRSGLHGRLRATAPPG
jgi:hypothetical protein